MKAIVVFCLFLLILFGCSQQNENISMQDKKIYVLITARKGSKGIKNKNLKKIYKQIV